MKGLRLWIMFIIVIIIIFMSIFHMQLKGYEKIGRVEEWSIYYNEDFCIEDDVLVYDSTEGSYEFECVNSKTYIVKSGFEEHSLLDALNEGYIELSDIEDIINFTVLPSE